MPTTTHCPPDQHEITQEPSVRRRADSTVVAGAAAPGSDGFLRLLARRTVAQARAEGPVPALRNLVRAESFLRSFRQHLLLMPREARGESYNIGLIMIELMIMREALRSPGRPLSV